MELQFKYIILGNFTYNISTLYRKKVSCCILKLIKRECNYEFRQKKIIYTTIGIHGIITVN